jgi:hypothetical protein
VITVPSEHQNGQLHQELPVQHIQDRCLHGRYSGEWPGTERPTAA